MASTAVGHLRRVADVTPVERERYVDFLRAMSILVVVVGHFLGTVIWVRAGRIGQDSLLGSSPQLKLVTWVAQIMPVFFFVGGFANFTSLAASRRRGERVATYLRRRAERLLRPSLVFLGAWTGLQVTFHLTGVGGHGLVRLSGLPFGPLWFLGVYLGVVLVSPLMAAAHRRFRTRAVAALILAAAAVDIAHLHLHVAWVGWANFGFVWLMAHQLGFFYADGTLTRLSRRALAGMAAAGLAGMVALTLSHLYPVSMVGNPGDRFSNMNPPTLAIVALTFWLVGLTMLVRDPVSRWLAGRRPWVLVVAGNQMCMTVYLWHLTAMLFASILLVHLGLRPSPVQPLFLPVAFAGVAALVWLFQRFERPTLRQSGQGGQGVPA